MAIVIDMWDEKQLMVKEMLTCAVPAGNFPSRDAFGLMLSLMASENFLITNLVYCSSLAIVALVELAVMCFAASGGLSKHQHYLMLFFLTW